jgi:hypothetical protein
MAASTLELVSSVSSEYSLATIALAGRARAPPKFPVSTEATEDERESAKFSETSSKSPRSKGLIDRCQSSSVGSSSSMVSIRSYSSADDAIFDMAECGRGLVGDRDRAPLRGLDLLASE